MPDGLDFASLPRWCVFTEPDVVRRALDAIGWGGDADLSAARLLEPAAGDGAFVVEAARRLILSRDARGLDVGWESLKDAIVACEIEPTIAAALRSRVSETMKTLGIHSDLADPLAERWCREADFLSARIDGTFTHAVGNPPFRRAGGAGADACVPFVARSFDLLRDGGRMAMLAPVALGSATGARRMRVAIGLAGTLESVESYEPEEAFARPVSVRGALFVVRRGAPAPPADTPNGLWLAGSPEARAVFQEACDRYPTLEQAGCRVRLGIATGRNSVFVRRGSDLDVEEDLLVPVVATRDLAGPGIRWRGDCVPDTHRPDGRPWTRREKPRLHSYLAKHREELQARHTVAIGGSWRLLHTRVDRQLAAAPKVLVAETAKPCRVALDPGGHMPLNSVHAVTSSEWPLPALQAILASAAVGLVANALLLRRGGGHLRVNATALRQVRIPYWKDLSRRDREDLLSGDSARACDATVRIFRMTEILLHRCAGVCRS